MTRTKIICTIGPSCNTLEGIIDLCKAGMNVARLNFSHSTQADHLKVIELLKTARSQLGIPLAIMLDTKGPEIRVGNIHGHEMEMTAGDHVRIIGTEDALSDLSAIPIHPGFVLKSLVIGARILFDDGYISTHVIATDEKGVTVSIDNHGLLKSGKGVNIPDVDVNLPAVTEKDIDDIRFGCLHNVDFIAASFVRSPEHVLLIKGLLEAMQNPEIQLIAKIENAEGVRNFDSIVQVSDGIMIARGDLGVEVPLSEVPRLQKMMIRKCYLAGKPSVTATQMLESMIHHPRPTRAEVSDVANAIYDSTSAVMLSGETAVGKYALDAVKVMKSIIQEAEADFNYRDFFDNYSRIAFHDVPSAVCLATVKTAYSSNAKAIFAFTYSGSTARLISRFRPAMPIIAMTPNEKCYHQMSFYWGTFPYLQNHSKNVVEAFAKISSFALDKEWVNYGDLVVITAGSPFGISGTTNMMIVDSIGEVLIRGERGFGDTVYGNITLVPAPEQRMPYTVSDQLIVIAKCDESYAPFIKEALGVILQNMAGDLESERYLKKLAKELNKPVLMRADAAYRILKEGQLVTLDPEKNLIYKGAMV